MYCSSFTSNNVSVLNVKGEPGIRPASRRLHAIAYTCLPFVTAAAGSINRTGTAAHGGVLPCYTFNNHCTLEKILAAQ